jgi:hypothetical protein
VPSGDAIEGLARVAYLELDVRQAIETWERVYAVRRSAATRSERCSWPAPSPKRAEGHRG